MNRAHLDLLASDEWKDILQTLILPFAFEGVTVADLGDDVLEIGPGPGLTTDLLAGQVAALTAIELDDDLASDLVGRYGADSTVEVVSGDATAMPFDDGRFSGVVCFTMLHHVPEVADQDRLFTEVCRVISPGGLFVASDSRASDDLAALHDDDVYNPIDPAGVESRLLAAGFGDVSVRWNEFGWAAQARR